MPRLGKGWKECGFDTSPPRPEPTGKAALEVLYGQRIATVNAWALEGKLTYDPEMDQYIATKTGVHFNARDLLDDVLFANLALAVQVGA